MMFGVRKDHKIKRAFGNIPKTLGFSGAGEGIRTSDLLITSQLLYQLSYTGLHPYSKRKYYTLYSWLVKLPPRQRPRPQRISIWHIFIV